jgi:hypothetical protein
VKYADLVEVEVVEMPNSPLLLLLSYQEFKSEGWELTAGERELWQNVRILSVVNLQVRYVYKVSCE